MTPEHKAEILEGCASIEQYARAMINIVGTVKMTLDEIKEPPPVLSWTVVCCKDHTDNPQHQSASVRHVVATNADEAVKRAMLYEDAAGIPCSVVAVFRGHLEKVTES